MHRVVEVVLLTILALLCMEGLLLAPGACLGLLLKSLAVVAGLVLLVWLWGWRRPALRRHRRRLAQAVRTAAQSLVPVQSAYWMDGPSSLGDIALRVVVASDLDRSILEQGGLRAEFDGLVEESRGLFPDQGRVVLTVDSQETVDREWGGDWYSYDK